jgi:CheY-like chemotaxis protein
VPTPWVLVVDDDDAIRDALATTLEDAGYRVRAEADGRAALAVMAAEPPSLLLLDLMMPGMDGWEVLREMEMSRVLSKIPVCIVTAHPALAPATNAGVLAKPLELATLLAVVARHCPTA